jgi:SAM-dependent methyltransferase
LITLPWFAPLFYTVFALAVIWFISVIGPFFFGAPWVPMPVSVARRMLQLANLQPGETVYDLGSGDGRVLIVAAREFNANGVGLEIDPLRALLSQLTLRWLGLGHRARVVRANLFDVPLAEADVVTIYLLPKAVARLAPKLKIELKPGARVVTLTYHLLEWQPIVQETNIRVYKV